MLGRSYKGKHETPTVSLLDHLLALMAAHDMRYQQRFEAQEKALVNALESINSRLAILNELRSGIATEQQLESVKILVADLSSRIKGIESRSGGMRDGLGYIVAAVTIVGAIITFIATR